MEVIINVFDATHKYSKASDSMVIVRKTFMFSLSVSVSNGANAAEVVNFAESDFSLANVQFPNDWYAGLRQAYLGLKSAYHFRQGVHIETRISTRSPV